MIEITAAFFKDKLNIIILAIDGEVYTITDQPNYYHTPTHWIYKVITAQNKIFDLKFDLDSFTWSIEAQYDI